MNAVLGRRVLQPDQPEPPRGQGVHLRRPLVSSSSGSAPARSTPAASVQTNVTKEALAELIKELTDVTGPRTITEKELDFAKDRIVRGFPAQFETTGAVAGTLAELVFYDLPDDEFTTYPSRVAAVTKADVDRVARKYLHPDRITILVVGDRSKVEGPLKTLPFVRVVNLLDPEGNPLARPRRRVTGT